ncbi:hypothetical protein P171DRAFT_488846 [Karstenula rhodostoma CBS 690.94]|uniref:Uncharacterized protein n=1 Tax=Karstenula rhodostoma CBS 690.94 TaxID=1392251 RepID=A0A9P4U9P6_9PLEO|nr:hypothetical protein P171DRAFT_488846 [Karstenula rhodostoma CBS 690.94]
MSTQEGSYERGKLGQTVAYSPICGTITSFKPPSVSLLRNASRSANANYQTAAVPRNLSTRTDASYPTTPMLATLRRKNRLLTSSGCKYAAPEVIFPKTRELSAEIFSLERVLPDMWATVLSIPISNLQVRL